MSWASVYWDLDHIVQAARQAMESAYAVEMAAQSMLVVVPNPTPVFPPPEKSVVGNLNAHFSGIAHAANVDPLKTVETALSIGKPAGVNPGHEIKNAPPPEKASDSLEASLNKSLLTAKMPTDSQTNVPMRSRWTPEIEAALREFMRPLSINLRYEYRFPDTLDEKRSIAAINSLFKQPAKPEDVKIRDVSAGNEIRRKRKYVFDSNAKKPDHKALK